MHRDSRYVTPETRTRSHRAAGRPAAVTPVGGRCPPLPPEDPVRVRSSPRMPPAFAGDYTGLEIQRTLIRRANRLKIPMLDSVYITRLPAHDGAVFGAYGFDQTNGTRHARGRCASTWCGPPQPASPESPSLPSRTRSPPSWRTCPPTASSPSNSSPVCLSHLTARPDHFRCPHRGRILVHPHGAQACALPGHARRRRARNLQDSSGLLSQPARQPGLYIVQTENESPERISS